MKKLLTLTAAVAFFTAANIGMCEGDSSKPEHKCSEACKDKCQAKEGHKCSDTCKDKCSKHGEDKK